MGAMDPKLADSYLELLGVERSLPTLDSLRRLVRAHIQRVPFENISKLYYLKTRGLRGVPDLALFLHGIENCGFGGTCYSNNPYFYGLLTYLGFDVALCGADMSEPDVHIVLAVRIEGKRYLVDTGYAAPFYEPMLLDSHRDIRISMGNECWILKPPDANGHSSVEHWRDARKIHGYRIKPQLRPVEYFESIIADSFCPESTFMRNLRLVRFGRDDSLAISNLTLIRSNRSSHSIHRLRDIDQLVRIAEREFQVDASVMRQAIDQIGKEFLMELPAPD